MICPHCGKLLVEDRFMDWTARWRCLKCGHVQDSISVENHLASQLTDMYGQSEGISESLSCAGEKNAPMLKRKITGLMVFTLLTLSSVPALGAWVEVSTNVEAGETVYFDPESIRRNGDIAVMWALYDSKTAQPAVGKAYLSRKVQNEYNCKEEMKRMVSVIEYSGNMGTGTVVHMGSTFFSSSEWKPVRSGVGEKLLKIACGRK